MTLLTTLALALLTSTASADRNPMSMSDGAWLAISGKALSPTADSFVLDYGDGLITVEVDDWNSYDEAHPLMDGDDVTVYGRIDNALFEARTIEAGSIYVEELNTHLSASAVDEEGDATWVDVDPVMPVKTHINGIVERIDHKRDRFTIDTGAVDVKVDTDMLGYDPLDNKGFQQIDIGDRVSVYGELDHGFFQGNVISADSVVTLRDSKY